MSDGAKLIWTLVGAVVILVGVVLLQIWLIKLGWNYGMENIAPALGLDFHRISFETASDITLMLWFFGGPLVGWNTWGLARRSDVKK